MSEPEAYPRQHPSLALRGKVRPVARINRKVLMVGAGLAVFGFLAAVSVALAPPKAADEDPAGDTFNLSNIRRPEALSQLPATYDTPSLPADVPRLGAPMAGDLGGTIIAEERRLGLEPAWDIAPTDDFRPSDDEEASRARRLAEAKLADEARKAGVFFALRSRPDESTAPPAQGLQLGAASELLALAGRQAALAPPQAGESAGSQAARNLAFTAEPRAGPDTNPYTVERPASPYQVMAGSIISASLITGLNSDLPGTVIAQVTQPVYDTVTGAHLLIPQGARLLGRYQSEVSFGQDRALIVWDRIIFPNGSSVRISEPGTDAAGFAGLSDQTDNHWDRVFAAAGLATLLGIGAELGDDDEDNIERAVRRGFGDTVSRSGEAIVERGLSVQPTIRVRPGWPASVLVTRDLVLEPYAGPGAN